MAIIGLSSYLYLASNYAEEPRSRFSGGHDETINFQKHRVSEFVLKSYRIIVLLFAVVPNILD